jgi:ribosomal protein L39E
MKKQYDPTAQMRKWRAEKLKEGWQYINLLLPPHIKDKVVLYKCKLMDEYKLNQPTSTTNTKSYDPTKQ